MVQGEAGPPHQGWSGHKRAATYIANVVFPKAKGQEQNQQLQICVYSQIRLKHKNK